MLTHRELQGRVFLTLETCQQAAGRSILSQADFTHLCTMYYVYYVLYILSDILSQYVI